MNENHTRVEAYLDQLLVPLARNLSDFHRDELRHKLRRSKLRGIEPRREPCLSRFGLEQFHLACVKRS